MNSRPAASSLLCLIIGVWLGGACAEENKSGDPAPSDFPQFMGLTRNGKVVGGPKLLDAWPKGGPKLLWKSGPLPEAPKNGIGCPVLADGKVYTFACAQLPQPGIVPITPERLASM